MSKVKFKPYLYVYDVYMTCATVQMYFNIKVTRHKTSEGRKSTIYSLWALGLSHISQAIKTLVSVPTAILQI